MVSKAVVFECVRQAQEQKRCVYLYSFSSSSEVEGHEVQLERKDALARLIAFLGRSFGGGTDVDVPLKAAVRKLHEPSYRNGDILLVSDGEFSSPSKSVMDEVDDVRRTNGIKVHGLLIGQQENPMRDMCDEFHVFKTVEGVVDRV